MFSHDHTRVMYFREGNTVEVGLPSFSPYFKCFLLLHNLFKLQFFPRGSEVGFSVCFLFFHIVGFPFISSNP